jgi:hypothetical protein
LVNCAQAQNIMVQEAVVHNAPLRTQINTRKFPFNRIVSIRLPPNQYHLAVPSHRLHAGAVNVNTGPT